MTDREAAVKTLFKIHIDGELCHIALKNALDKADAEDGTNNNAWITRAVNGVTERLLTLYFLIEKQSGRSIGKIKPKIRLILALGIYQGLYMKVPVSAACNESVKLAKKFGFAGLGGFVNAVLRGFFRDYEAAACSDPAEYIEKLLDGGNEKRRLEILYSVPGFIIDNYLDYMDYGECEEFLSHTLDNESELCIYRLKSSCGSEELEKSLLKDGCRPEKIQEPNGAYVLKNVPALKKLEAYEKGFFIVQNPSSALAAEFPELSGEEKVIDVCAAPGGKAIHIADRLVKGGSVTACDISDGKVELIRENIKRCGLDNIKAQKQDALIRVGKYEGAFDLVVADLPCSGLGVIANKPDIKYKTKPGDIKELSALQRKILANVSAYVKKGGQLMFSTCTLTRAENDENADYIKTLGFTEIKRKSIMPGAYKDGFFAALFVKN